MERRNEPTFACPVCGSIVFEEEDDFDICEICGWENDNIQNHEPDFAGGANDISLNEARRRWARGVTCWNKEGTIPKLSSEE